MSLLLVTAPCSCPSPLTPVELMANGRALLVLLVLFVYAAVLFRGLALSMDMPWPRCVVVAVNVTVAAAPLSLFPRPTIETTTKAFLS